MPEIDVVIATRNRPEGLRSCLEALTRQTISGFGVIVVDDASDLPVGDGLPAAIGDALDLRILRQQQQGGPARARNAGVEASDARYIAFVDDDVRVDPDTLRLHLAGLEQADGTYASIGPLAAPPDWDPTPWNLWEARTLETQYERMLRGDYEPTWRQFHTGNALLEREAFLAVGGFDERFTRAEDVELALRLHLQGGRFLFEPRAIGWHYARRTLDAWLRIPRAYARFDAEIDALYPELRWLEQIVGERARRRAPLRSARRILGRRALRPLATTAATASARVLFRLRLRDAAVRALSLAYDLEYSAALQAVMAEPASARLKRKHAA